MTETADRCATGEAMTKSRHQHDREPTALELYDLLNPHVMWKPDPRFIGDHPAGAFADLCVKHWRVVMAALRDVEARS